ncbi:GNAT family N-acetyltransferase [Salinicoccus siamensis]|uniref:GNAT family N-acetyltransferase n=1 Tax=Salinicoccus siamensis TaxID=381830 RepID=A0ABV5Z1P1_9STAP
MAVDIKKGEDMLFVEEDELNPKAKMVFEKDDDGDYVVTHTEVSGDLGGEGIGTRLVETMVDLAAGEKRKITPLCSFTRSVMENDDKMRKMIKD